MTSRPLIALGLLVLVAACQLVGKGSEPPVASTITDPTVEVAPLADPVPPDAAADPVPPPADATAPLATDSRTSPTADPAKPVPEPAVAAPPRSAEAIACERQGGRYVSVGRSNLKTCQRPTRDGGKQCRREADCEGQCLARSGSCAPFTPLFGCNDVLQADGRQVSLCIE